MIKGEIAAREKIIGIEPFRDKDGIGRCRLVMQPKVIAVSPRPMRPFQGWRYLTEMRAARSRQVRRRQRRGDAGADAARTARSRAALDRDIVDQPGRAELGRHQDPHRAVLERGDRRQRLGMAGLEIVERKTGVRDQFARRRPSRLRRRRRRAGAWRFPSWRGTAPARLRRSSGER